MVSKEQLKADLKIPEIVPPKRRNHTRGDIQSPAQRAVRERLKHMNHIVMGFQKYGYKYNGGTSRRNE